MWYTQRPATAPRPPDWRDTTNPWLTLGNRGPVSVPPGGAVSLGLFGRPPVASFGTRTWVLAIAHCADDPANTDASTALPTALTTTRPSIVDLVAGDNNLGLRVL